MKWSGTGAQDGNISRYQEQQVGAAQFWCLNFSIRQHVISINEQLITSSRVKGKGVTFCTINEPM